MVATADLVVLGSVSNVAPGREFGEISGELRYRDVTVLVERTLFQRITPMDVVTVQELGWIEGTSAAIEGLPWSRKGDRGYYFLQRDGKNGFTLIGAQGRILVGQDGAEPSGLPDLPAVQRLNGLSAEQLSQAIDAASADVKSRGLPKLPKGDQS